MIKELIKIKDDLLYIFDIGFIKIYPLLIPLLELTNILQTEDLSCAYGVILVEHYLHKIEESNKYYDIFEIGNSLLDWRKKRLLLNKSIAKYQLASLFTPAGIVRFRSIIKNRSVSKFSKLDWHNIK